MDNANFKNRYSSRIRALVVKVREDEYRMTKNLADACGIPISAVVRGLIWRAAVDNIGITTDEKSNFRAPLRCKHGCGH